MERSIHAVLLSHIVRRLGDLNAPEPLGALNELWEAERLERLIRPLMEAGWESAPGAG